MYWELWDTESKNLVDTFDSESEAIQAVREIVSVNRPDYLDALALSAAFDEGEARDTQLPPVLQGLSLRARLDEETPSVLVDGATRAVHEQIRRWLAEEGWHIREIDDPQSSFNVMATLQGENAPNVNIFQRWTHFDHITLSHHWTYDHKFQSALEQLPEDSLEDILWNVYRDVSMMGIQFSGLDTPTTEMTLRAYIYFDGLTKDALIQKILLSIRALSIAARRLVRALSDQSQPEQSVRTPESRIFTREELKKLMRVQPKTNDPVTITG